MTPLRIYIGYDSKEVVAFHVLCHSLMTTATVPISIYPLMQDQLRAMGVYTRERGATESTEFSLTRFLVPYLSRFQGLALFMDCDMLARADINDLVMYRQTKDKAVWVCQHEYEPQSRTKFLGQVQTRYPRKNWSSVMLFNCEKCTALTPEYVNTASGLDLHRFNWLKDEQIGALDLAWNWLVSEYSKNDAAKLVHFTLGGPWFPEYAQVDYADEWRDAYSQMTSASKAVAV